MNCGVEGSCLGEIEQCKAVKGLEDDHEEIVQESMVACETACLLSVRVDGVGEPGKVE